VIVFRDPRHEKIVTVGLAGLAALFVALWLGELLDVVRFPDRLAFSIGGDYALYVGAARDWLTGGTFYHARQLAGPYTIIDGDILYPPPALLLFLPFTMLPALMWWILPLGITAAVIAYHRPGPIAWPSLAFCLWWSTSTIKILSGNPVIWIQAAVALGTIWPAFALGALMKPSLVFFASWGIRHRSWWLGLAAMAFVSVWFLPLWRDYIRVLLDSRNPSGIAYSLGEIPLVAMPLLAWAAGTSHRRAAGEIGAR
jgi:hypothetical protein